MGDRLFEKWRIEDKGLYATNGAVLGFLARSSVAESNEPDLFIFGARIPGFFVVMPIYMIAEKAADAILADAPG
jgi:hypothetical protein